MSRRCPRGCEAIVSEVHLMCPADWYPGAPSRFASPCCAPYLNGKDAGGGALRSAQAAAVRAVNRGAGLQGGQA